MIKRWDLITIGNISRNRYWGEGDEKGVRSAICTCTLITGEESGGGGRGYRLLVDPSMQDSEQMRHELDRRSGLKLDEITHVFITHPHGDHHYGLRHFEKARWMAAAPVAAQINGEGKYTRSIDPLLPPPGAEKILGEIDLLHTPGHTEHHYSLRFDCEGLSVVIAGDATMTRDFFRDRRGYFNSSDFEAAARTIERLAALADIVVPGHDNYFLVKRTAGRGTTGTRSSGGAEADAEIG